MAAPVCLLFPCFLAFFFPLFFLPVFAFALEDDDDACVFALAGAATAWPLIIKPLAKKATAKKIDFIMFCRSSTIMFGTVQYWSAPKVSP